VSVKTSRAAPKEPDPRKQAGALPKAAAAANVKGDVAQADLAAAVRTVSLTFEDEPPTIFRP
jgi:hypothetical protein